MQVCVKESNAIINKDAMNIVEREEHIFYHLNFIVWSLLFF
jgi:hypothetical protein